MGKRQINRGVGEQRSVQLAILAVAAQQSQKRYFPCRERPEGA